MTVQYVHLHIVDRLTDRHIVLPVIISPNRFEIVYTATNGSFCWSIFIDDFDVNSFLDEAVELAHEKRLPSYDQFTGEQAAMISPHFRLNQFKMRRRYLDEIIWRIFV